VALAAGDRDAREDAFSPARRLSLGAGGGLMVGPEGRAAHLLAEATFTGLFSRKGASWGDSLVRAPNLSVGGSFGGGAKYVYGEVSGYPLFSAGVGAGNRFASSGSQVDPGAAYHFFFGLPIGVPVADPDLGLFGFAGMPYIEPYYRPQIGWSAGRGTIHEIGLLLRMSFGKPWSISF
jgi:hypothetical protein